MGTAGEHQIERRMWFDGPVALGVAEVQRELEPALLYRGVLTPQARETQIARLVAQGLANKAIAAELAISEWTVSTHLRRIFQKVGVDTRAAMVLRCFGARR